MKLTRGLVARVSAVAVGGLLLAGGASAAFADEVGDDSNVDVLVEIAPTVEPGTLTLTVAGTSETLGEVASGDPTLREFRGELPTVTVTDTRTVAEIEDGLEPGKGRWWYVVGQSSPFRGLASQPDISAGNFGWTPSVIDDGDGLVFEGDEVVTVEDDATMPGNNVGLVGQELLYGAIDSASIVDAGGSTSWSAGANLFLKTSTSVTPGAYKAVLTLSLFEDVY